MDYNDQKIKENSLDQALDNTDISFEERLAYDKMVFYYAVKS